MGKQLECIFRTNYDDRILHIDATGSLVNVGCKQNNYKWKEFSRMLNYFFIMNNKKFINDKTGRVMISEFVTSSQNVLSINSNLQQVKYDYERIYKQKLKFLVIVSDFSWVINLHFKIFS